MLCFGAALDRFGAVNFSIVFGCVVDFFSGLLDCSGAVSIENGAETKHLNST